MEKLTKPVNDAELYSIEQDLDCGSGKVIHILSYVYQSDVDWRMVDGTFLYVPLDEFIENYAERGAEYINELWEDTKQYEGEMTEEECLKQMNLFIEENQAEHLEYDKITIDTPYGAYIKL